MDRWTRRSFLAAGLSLGACTHLDKPPLGALYRPTQQTLDQPPLVVIPGMFGSRLRDVRTGHVIWPGSSAELVVSDFRALEVEIDPATLEPRAVRDAAGATEERFPASPNYDLQVRAFETDVRGGRSLLPDGEDSLYTVCRHQ